MSWYDNAKTTIAVQPYNVTDTRKGVADAEKQELANKGTQFDQTQKQNMDYAFTNSVEQKKVVDPKTGAITYSLYLDPDKYSNALFQQSKKTGIPFNMDDAQAYSKYQLERQQRMNQQGQAAIQSQQIGIQPEAKINPTRQETVQGSLPTPTVGETRKAKDGKTYTFDGKGWYDASQEVGF